MKRNRLLISKFRDQRGVTAVVVAIVIAVLMGIVALAVDIGYVAATKNELQNAADSAALAGAGLLGQIYLNMNLTQQQAYICDNEDHLPSDAYANDSLSIIAQAQDVVGSGKNKAGGQDISIVSTDVLINTWTGTPFTISNYNQPDAVKVTVRRDAAANGPITTFFAKIFGISTADVRADATAALTGPAVMNEGEMNLPIGLSKWQFFDVDNCDMGTENEGICSEEITFSPTTESCAGWHNFFDPINASDEEEKLLGFIEGNECEGDDCEGVPSNEPLNGDEWLDQKFDIADHKQPPVASTPETTAGGSMYFFQGGTISSLFNGAVLLWDDDDTLGDEGIRTVPRLQDPNSLYDPVSNPQLIDGQAKTPAPFPALFDYFRFRDGDGDNSVWTAVAPVYEDGCPCDNPNTELTILGFASVTVRMPNPPPDSTVTATVYCDFQVIDGRGGGGTYGSLKGSIPNLVE